MKKTEIIIITVVVILFLIVILSLIFLKQPTEKPEEEVFPQPTSSPSSPPEIFIPKELEKEKQDQENYAKRRQEFISQKPWILKFPLKSTNYFVSYDPENDQLRASIYYFKDSSIPKSQQLEKAQQEALAAIQALGIDISKQAIIYIETQR